MRLDLIDVFGARPLMGNPLAVVRGGGDLSPGQMLALTRWLGFSETTFLLPPTDARADYRVRIFYPAGELPFAGHPTLGSCHAWVAAGGVPRDASSIVQQCPAGLISVRKMDGGYGFSAPPFTRYEPLSGDERHTAITLAGVDERDVIEAHHVANGPAWQLLRLRSAEAVLAAQPASHAPVGTDIGLAGPSGVDGIDWEVRAFFTDPVGRLREDPVTGSFNAGLAKHLFANGLAQGEYFAAQGRCTGADGRVICSHAGDDVWIAGATQTISRDGELMWPGAGA